MNVQGIKIGNTINFSINGKLHRKACNDANEADELFSLIIKAKENPSKENIANIWSVLNKNIRTALVAVLVCLVNPANVVAVPNYDHSKIRVSEYFPFATAEYSNGKIDIIDQPYFEMDYCIYEHNDLVNKIEKIKNEESINQTAMNADVDTRGMSELTKIIENRLVDINHDIVNNQFNQ